MTFPPAASRAMRALTRATSCAISAGLLVFQCLHAEPVEDDGKWWSVQPVVRPVVPQISGVDADHAPTNPIDAFIRAKLAEKHLAPAPEADRRTLIRRLSFDLLG